MKVSDVCRSLRPGGSPAHAARCRHASQALLCSQIRDLLSSTHEKNREKTESKWIRFPERIYVRVSRGQQEYWETLQYPALQVHEKGKLFEPQWSNLVGGQGGVAEPGDGSLDDLHILVNGASADTDTTNKVVVLVDGQTTTKDNKTTVGLLNTCKN